MSSANCTVEDGDSRSVTVAFGDTATTAFAVTCAFRQIAFSSGRDGNGEVYVMNSDGTAVTRLTTAAGVDRLPAWSPDGMRIAFSANRDGDQEIYIVDADGTNVIRLTNDAQSDAAPTWRP